MEECYIGAAVSGRLVRRLFWSKAALSLITLTFLVPNPLPAGLVLTLEDPGPVTGYLGGIGPILTVFGTLTNTGPVTEHIESTGWLPQPDDGGVSISLDKCCGDLATGQEYSGQIVLVDLGSDSFGSAGGSFTDMVEVGGDAGLSGENSNFVSLTITFEPVLPTPEPASNLVVAFGAALLVLMSRSRKSPEHGPLVK